MVGTLLPWANPMLEGIEASSGGKGDFYGTWAHTRGDEAEEKSDVSVPGIFSNVNDRFAHRNPVSELNIPRDRGGMMSLSMAYAEDNYIVAAGIKTKKNFTLKDMTILGSDTTRAHYASEFTRLRIRKLLSNLLRYYFMVGEVVVYWGEDRPVRFVQILNPRQTLVREFLGVRMAFYKPDRTWKEILTRPQDSPEGRLLKRALPKYWIKYILTDKEIPLKDGTYAVIQNDLSLFPERGLIGGMPLQPAFNALSIHRMHMAGDFSVAWMMKNLIALVSIGDPKNEKGDYTRSDQIELNKLKATFQKPEYAMWAYVDPTVQIRWSHPDPKLFDSSKMIESTKQIERTLGVPAVFSAVASSDGKSDFGSGTLSLKPFREEIEFARADLMDQFFSEFLPVLREGYTRRKAGTKDCELSFDQNTLKEDSVITDELNGKFDRGALSIQSLLAGVSQNIDIEMARKTIEAKLYGTTAKPIWDMNHGTLTSDKVLPEMQADAKAQSTPAGKPGRPTTTNKPTQEKVRGSATPRPSKS